jgi:hypothetical protein
MAPKYFTETGNWTGRTLLSVDWPWSVKLAAAMKNDKTTGATE